MRYGQHSESWALAAPTSQSEYRVVPSRLEFLRTVYIGRNTILRTGYPKVTNSSRTRVGSASQELPPWEGNRDTTNAKCRHVHLVGVAKRTYTAPPSQY